MKVRHQEHSKAVDFWGMGVLIYELSYGKSPFQGNLRIYTTAFSLFLALRSVLMDRLLARPLCCYAAFLPSRLLWLLVSSCAYLLVSWVLFVFLPDAMRFVSF